MITVKNFGQKSRTYFGFARITYLTPEGEITAQYDIGQSLFDRMLNGRMKPMGILKKAGKAIEGEALGSVVIDLDGESLGNFSFRELKTEIKKRER